MLLCMTQVCTEFMEAHPDHKMAKTRLHAKVKEIAERPKDRWIIHPQALQDAGPASCLGQVQAFSS